MALDFARINAAALSEFETLLRQWLPGGHKSGNEWEVCCPFHNEKTASLKINIVKGVWHCFGCGKGGTDPISLYADINDWKQGVAAKRLNERYAIPEDQRQPMKSKLGAPREHIKPVGNQEWLPIVPVPPDVSAPLSFGDWHYGEPEHVWTYRGPNNELLGYIRRFKKTTPKDDGTFGKEIKPLVWAQSSKTGLYEWRAISFDKPRPLYGLDILAQHKPDAGVCLVEGEKAADAGREIIPGVVMTWPGGGKAVKHCDWTPLKGRRVLFWPDRDRHKYKEKDAPSPELIGTEIPWREQVGYKTALAVGGALKDIAASFRIIDPPEGEDITDGWDAADALEQGWDRAMVTAHIRSRLAEAAPAPAPESEIVAVVTGPPPPPRNEDEEPAARRSDTPFDILGMDNGHYYYLSHSSRQVVCMPASSHKGQNMLQIAPLNYWEMAYPGKTGPDWMAAANSLIQQAQCHIFDPDVIRGRGAWIDRQRVVYHAGDVLHVDGKRHVIQNFNSDYIYQRGRAVPMLEAEPATAQSAALLVECLRNANFSNPMDHLLLAGWLMCAPICGALEWRPHLWLSGKAGAGKTWLIQKIVQSIIGGAAVIAQGTSTTEAGIRQSLLNDAFPVVMDEAETENKQDQERIQKIIMLARQASRESRARIIKGSTGGDPMSFTVRSMFLFASIGVSATQRADLSRITAMELVTLPDGEEKDSRWARLQSLQRETAASAQWCASIRARGVKLASVIAHNAHVFASACAPLVGAQRDGDQIGALLAGAYALSRDGEISPEEAVTWCANKNWTAFSATASDMDESRALSVLLQAIIQHQEADRNYRLSISELINQALRAPEGGDRSAAGATLERHGVRVRSSGVDISNGHGELKRIFENTPFAGKWADQFKRLDGAVAIPGSKFNGSSCRAVRLPRAMFANEPEPLSLESD